MQLNLDFTSRFSLPFIQARLTSRHPDRDAVYKEGVMLLHLQNIRGKPTEGLMAFYHNNCNFPLTTVSGVD